MSTEQVLIEFTTNLGSFKVSLDPKVCPDTVANFIDYVKSGFYNNTLFHRVIAGFMIQGGGFDTDFVQKDTKAPILNEAKSGLKNTKGTIAMARTSAPHSATSQFFINVADNSFLDFRGETPDAWGYCAFGEVIEGMDVIMEISTTNTTSRAGHQDVPVTDVVLLEVKHSPELVAEPEAAQA